MCLTLCLAALFGCAKKAEESIPEGWVEYDLQKTGMKIALPPHYVAAERDGLPPSAADFDRTGVAEEDREYYRNTLLRGFELDTIMFFAISPETGERGMIVAAIGFGEKPESIREQAFNLDEGNVDLLREVMVEEAKKLGPQDPAVEIEENLIGIKHAFTVLRRINSNGGIPIYKQQYNTVWHGRGIELVFTIAEEDVNDSLHEEFAQAAYWLRVE